MNLIMDMLLHRMVSYNISGVGDVIVKYDGGFAHILRDVRYNGKFGP